MTALEIKTEMNHIRKMFKFLLNVHALVRFAASGNCMPMNLSMDTAVKW